MFNMLLRFTFVLLSLTCAIDCFFWQSHIMRPAKWVRDMFISPFSVVEKLREPKGESSNDLDEPTPDFPQLPGQHDFTNDEILLLSQPNDPAQLENTPDNEGVMASLLRPRLVFDNVGDPTKDAESQKEPNLKGPELDLESILRPDEPLSGAASGQDGILTPLLNVESIDSILKKYSNLSEGDYIYDGNNLVLRIPQGMANMVGVKPDSREGSDLSDQKVYTIITGFGEKNTNPFRSPERRVSEEPTTQNVNSFQQDEPFTTEPSLSTSTDPSQEKLEKQDAKEAQAYSQIQKGQKFLYGHYDSINRLRKKVEEFNANETKDGISKATPLSVIQAHVASGVQKLMEESLEEFFYYMKKEYDENQCVSLIFCEMAVDPQRYGGAGNKFNSFFKNSKFSDKKVASNWFKSVIKFGETASLKTCRSTYASCSYNTNELAKLIHDLMLNIFVD